MSLDSFAFCPEIIIDNIIYNNIITDICNTLELVGKFADFDSERLQEIQLRSQMENLKIQRQRSVERNQMIRKQMREFEVNMSAMSAKTQRLRTLKVTLPFYVKVRCEQCLPHKNTDCRFSAI